VLAVAEKAYERPGKGQVEWHQARKMLRCCYVGRLDDYIRDVAQDRAANVTESDIIQAGTAVLNGRINCSRNVDTRQL